MSGMNANAPGDLSAVASLEEKLASTLKQTSQEVSRVEGLDTEQRAEIYAILEALKADTEVHRAMVDMLAKKRAAHA